MAYYDSIASSMTQQAPFDAAPQAVAHASAIPIMSYSLQTNQEFHFDLRRNKEEY